MRPAQPFRSGGEHGPSWPACRNDRCGTAPGLSVAAHPRTACRERPLGAAAVRHGSALAPPDSAHSRVIRPSLTGGGDERLSIPALRLSPAAPSCSWSGCGPDLSAPRHRRSGVGPVHHASARARPLAFGLAEPRLSRNPASARCRASARLSTACPVTRAERDRLSLMSWRATAAS